MVAANLFLCHNPFHFYISSQICKERFASDQYENWIVSPLKNASYDARFNYILARNDLFGKIIALWEIKRKVKHLASKYKTNLHVFLPHTDGIIGNYVFESEFIKNKGVKINFYYEGIVMLDEKRMERKFPRSIKQKALLSLFILHRFVKHDDILPLDSPRIDKIYTPYPDKTPAQEQRKVGISFQRENIETANGGVLIVGVDAGESLSESIIGLVQFLDKEKGITKFFFKPHYADQHKVFERIANEKGFKYDLVQDSRCIEELMGDLKVEMVICTHLSSALLNLKMIYKNEMRVIFLAHPKTIIALGTENVNFAANLGVEIKNLNQI